MSCRNIASMWDSLIREKNPDIRNAIFSYPTPCEDIDGIVTAGLFATSATTQGTFPEGLGAVPGLLKMHTRNQAKYQELQPTGSSTTRTFIRSGYGTGWYSWRELQMV